MQNLKLAPAESLVGVAVMRFDLLHGSGVHPELQDEPHHRAQTVQTVATLIPIMKLDRHTVQDIKHVRDVPCTSPRRLEEVSQSGESMVQAPSSKGSCRSFQVATAMVLSARPIVVAL